MTPDRPRCRLLSFLSADGPAQMAADDVLLESAGAGAAALRFYSWSVPTLSLGYFQPARLREQDPLLASLPWLRRPSGGAALVHHHELTYALALPAGLPWHGGEPWLCRMHRVIAAALARLGAVTQSCCAVEAEPITGVLCFQHQTRGDLLIETSKVVGSAQRRQRGALLQHGAILLAASPFAPQLPGIRELCGRQLAPEEVQDTVQRAFAEETGWHLCAEGWTEREQERRTELTVVKYRKDAWNRKR